MTSEKEEISDLSLSPTSEELDFSEAFEADETDEISISNEINESNWLEIAKETLKMYYNRGGIGVGEQYQLLSSSELINIVGYALSIVPNVDPKKWDKDHLEMAQKGDLTYYEDKALEAIEKITKKITHECHDAREIYVTIFPVSFFFQNFFYTLPVIRFKKMKTDPEKYIDNIGRIYKNFTDWLHNNRLPACDIFYPKDGILSLNEDTKEVDFILEPSAESKRPVKTLLACDILYGTMGVLGGIGATIATGGAALVMMGAVGLSASYGAGRSALKLKDRAKHKETINPLHNKEAFWLWLGIGADVVTFGTIGAASAKLVSSISTGTKFVEIGHKMGSASRVMSIFHGATKPLTDGASILVTGFKIFEEIKHQNNLKALPASLLLRINGSEEFDEINMLLMSVTQGFWTKQKMVYCSPEQFQAMVEEQILNNLSDQCENPEMLSKVSSYIQNDQILVELFKCLGVNLTIPESVQFLHDLIVNEKNIDVKFDLTDKMIYIGDLEVSFDFLTNLRKQELLTILTFFFKMSLVEKNNFNEIRSYISDDKSFFALLSLEEGKSSEVLETLYDVFALTFSNNLMKINGDTQEISIGSHKFSIELLMKLSKEERRYMILNLLNFDEVNFQEFREKFENDEKLLKILGSGNEISSIKEELSVMIDCPELKNHKFLENLKD